MNKRQTQIGFIVTATTIAVIILVTLSVTLSGRRRDKTTSAALIRQITEAPSPSVTPSLIPSSTPSLAPSLTPSPYPSVWPTWKPSLRPSEAPEHNLTDFLEGIFNDTLAPSSSTSLTVAPNGTDSQDSPSLSPSSDVDGLTDESPAPTMVPTRTPTISNQNTDSLSPMHSLSPSIEVEGQNSTFPSTVDSLNLSTAVRFYAIGDVPYSDREAVKLAKQMEELESDAEFLIHVGDIRFAGNGARCELEEYEEVASILNMSHAPVFIVIGDNEWNDCPNVNQAFEHWMNVFYRFDERWNHSFNITRLESRPENFRFVHKRTLFLGLNLPGGRINHRGNWEQRLKDLYEWVTASVDVHLLSSTPDADSVVIFGHADPGRNHRDFFHPLAEFVGRDDVSKIPFLYLNGDSHVWDFRDNFFDRPNFVRIQVEAKARDPPVQISLDNELRGRTDPSHYFKYNRMLPLDDI